MIEFKMPSLGADMEFGYLVEWFVKPGDVVQRGDILCDVETQKGVFEVECFEEGVVEQLMVQPGRDEVPVGTVLALLRAESEEAVPEPAVPSPTPAAAPVPAAPPAPEAAPADEPEVRASPLARKIAQESGVDIRAIHGTGPRGTIMRADVERTAHDRAQDGERLRVSPAARRLAEKLSVDLSAVVGTGPDGAITRKDIERAAATSRPEPARAPTSFAEGMRQAIAKAMARSNADIPHYYLETAIDMTQALAWLDAENQQRSIKDRILPAVVLIKAVASSLEAVPQLNGFWVDDALQMQEDIHIGFAIALRGTGLITPAIQHANKKSLDEMMAALRDLIQRTRAGNLRSSEMMNQTITLTSLGDLGVETVFGVIYPPQVALVGLGRITETPWAEGGMLGVRPVLRATLAADHRATDGRIGGQFLDVLKKNLQEVDKLWQ